jgi:integrase
MGLQKLRGLGIMARRAERTLLRGLSPKAVRAHEKRLASQRAIVHKLARENAPKYSLYAIRHSWATHALSCGFDALTVAILLGHRDPSALARTYQHLTQNPQYLREAAKRATA